MKSGKFVVHAAILVMILSIWKTLAAEPNEPRKLKAGDIKTPVIIDKYMCFESLLLRWRLNDCIFFLSSLKIKLNNQEMKNVRGVQTDSHCNIPEMMLFMM